MVRRLPWRPRAGHAAARPQCSERPLSAAVCEADPGARGDARKTMGPRADAIGAADCRVSRQPEITRFPASTPIILAGYPIPSALNTILMSAMLNSRARPIAEAGILKIWVDRAPSALKQMAHEAHRGSAVQPRNRNTI